MPGFIEQLRVEFKSMRAGVVTFPPSCTVSSEAQSLICQLLAAEPHMRIGASGGIDEVMQHSWFQDVCWRVGERFRV